MRNSKRVIDLLLEYGNEKHKPKRFFSPKKKYKLKHSLNDLITNPLTMNLKKDIVTRGNKMSGQITLSDGVSKIISTFSKYDMPLDLLVEFENSFYSEFNPQDHSERVMILSVIIGILEGLEKEDLETLIIASKLHDLGRLNNQFDLLHGQRSVSLIMRYKISGIENKQRENQLFAIIDSHSAYDKNIEGVLNKYQIPLANYSHVKKLCCIFKDAEALDKIRLFNTSSIDTERMIKTNMLKTRGAKSLIGLTFELNEYYQKNK